MKPLECWATQNTALLQALEEFEPLARQLPLGVNDMEGAMPVLTPTIANLKAVACVHAPVHQDLPYPRWSVLAPVIVRPGAVLSVTHDGVTHQRELKKGELIILDSHAPHALSAPTNWPSQDQLDALSAPERERLKRQHLSVFLNCDRPVRPTREQAEAMFCDLLHVSAPKPKARRFR